MTAYNTTMYYSHRRQNVYVKGKKDYWYRFGVPFVDNMGYPSFMALMDRQFYGQEQLFTPYLKGLPGDAVEIRNKQDWEEA